MNKPVSMSHKEWLIKRLAIKLVISERIIDAVITNQFNEANEMIPHKNSIEFSGFGKFMFKTKRAEYYMEKLQANKLIYEGILADETTSPAMLLKTQKKLDIALNNINALKDKIK